MTLFYLLRHGETDWNHQKRLQGQEDIPLNDTGREQAQRISHVIAGLDLAACYTSDLSRAFETAQLALSSHPASLVPVPVPELRERHFGRMSGMTHSEVQTDMTHNPHLYIEHHTRHFPVDGEQPGPFAERVQQAVTACFNRHQKPVLIVSHGGVIREIMRAFVRPPELVQPGNCHIFRFCGTNADWQMDRIWPQ
jgi:2,3-bisphosphoglycerate-dependent phosphoglycerate mutase